MLEVLQFRIRVQPARDRELLPIGAARNLDVAGAAVRQRRREIYGELFLPGEAEGIGGLAVLELEREDAHSH